MTALSFRDRLTAQPFRPFLVKTTDGDTFRVDHPDYAMINPTGADVAIYEANGHFRLVDLNHVVSLEPVRNGAKKPGKR